MGRAVTGGWITSGLTLISVKCWYSTASVAMGMGSPPHRRGIHQPTTTDAGAVTRYECTRSNVSKLCGAAQLNSTLAGVLRSDLDCLASA